MSKLIVALECRAEFRAAVGKVPKTGRYLVMGGYPVGDTFTDIRVVARCENEEQVSIAVDKFYDLCRGLMTIIDLETGQETIDF